MVKHRRTITLKNSCPKNLSLNSFSASYSDESWGGVWFSSFLYRPFKERKVCEALLQQNYWLNVPEFSFKLIWSWLMLLHLKLDTSQSHDSNGLKQKNTLTGLTAQLTHVLQVFHWAQSSEVANWSDFSTRLFYELNPCFFIIFSMHILNICTQSFWR